MQFNHFYTGKAFHRKIAIFIIGHEVRQYTFNIIFSFFSILSGFCKSISTRSIMALYSFSVWIVFEYLYCPSSKVYGVGQAQAEHDRRLNFHGSLPTIVSATEFFRKLEKFRGVKINGIYSDVFYPINYEQ